MKYHTTGSSAIILLSFMTIMCGFYVEQGFAKKKSNEDNDPKQKPWHSYDSRKSSPLLFVSGLKPQPDHFFMTRVYDHVNNYTSPEFQLNLTTILLRNEKENDPYPARILAVPQFELNHTSLLRISVMYPCRDPPPKEFGINFVPCWYEPLTSEEYNTYMPSSIEDGKKATFYLRYHPEPVSEGDNDVDEKKNTKSDESHLAHFDPEEQKRLQEISGIGVADDKSSEKEPHAENTFEEEEEEEEEEKNSHL